MTVFEKTIATYHAPNILEKSMKMTIRKDPVSESINQDFVYVSGTWLTLILVLFVMVVLTVFVSIKLHQRRSKSVSKYQLQISPIERVNEIQYEFEN